MIEKYAAYYASMNKSHCFLQHSSHSNWGVISRQDTLTSRTHWHGNARAAWRFDAAFLELCNAWCDFVRYVPTLANRHSAAVRSAGLEGGDIFVPAWMDLDLNGLVSTCLPLETGGKIASKDARHLGKQVDFRMHADWQGRMNFPCHSCIFMSLLPKAHDHAHSHDGEECSTCARHQRFGISSSLSSVYIYIYILYIFFAYTLPENWLI